MPSRHDIKPRLRGVLHSGAALAAIPAAVIVWLILGFIAFVARALFGLAWFGAMQI